MDIYIYRCLLHSVRKLVRLYDGSLSAILLYDKVFFFSKITAIQTVHCTPAQGLGKKKKKTDNFQNGRRYEFRVDNRTPSVDCSIRKIQCPPMFGNKNAALEQCNSTFARLHDDGILAILSAVG